MQIFNDVDGFAIVAVPYFAVFHLNELAELVEDGQLAAALKINKQKLNMLKLSELSLGELVALLNWIAVEDVLSSWLLGELAAQSLLEEVVELHEGLVQFSFSLAHR